MSVVRVLFLGTPDFAVPSLEALLEDEHFEVVGVVSQPDRPAGRNRKLTPSPVKAFAESRGFQVLTPEKVKKTEVLQQLRDLKADAAVVVAFGQILPQEFIDMFTFGAVNIHSSILPRWRGAAPIQRAIMAGDQESGVSLQKIVLKLDAGDVLGVRRVNLQGKNAVEVHDEMKVLATELLTIHFMDYIRGNLVGQQQDESLVTYAKKIEKSEGEIDWSHPAEEIYNQVRGLALGPKTWGFRDGKKLKILKVELSNESGAPGEVVSIEKNSFVIACGSGALKVLEVQPESKAKMPVEAYLKGYPLAKGDQLS